MLTWHSPRALSGAAALLALAVGSYAQVHTNQCKVAEPITSTVELMVDPVGLEVTPQSVEEGINSPDFMKVFTDAGLAADQICSWEITQLEAIDYTKFKAYFTELDSWPLSANFAKLSAAQKNVIQSLKGLTYGSYMALGFNGALDKAMSTGISNLLTASDGNALTSMMSNGVSTTVDVVTAAIDKVGAVGSCKLECLEVAERQKDRTNEDCQCVDFLFSNEKNAPFIKTFAWKNDGRQLVSLDGRELAAGTTTLTFRDSALKLRIRVIGDPSTRTIWFRGRMGDSMKNFMDRVYKQLSKVGWHTDGSTLGPTEFNTPDGTLPATELAPTPLESDQGAGFAGGATDAPTPVLSTDAPTPVLTDAPSIADGTFAPTTEDTPAPTPTESAGANKFGGVDPGCVGGDCVPTSAPTKAPSSGRRLEDSFHDISYEELLDVPFPEET